VEMLTLIVGLCCVAIVKPIAVVAGVRSQGIVFYNLLRRI
jgi:hypothetical protein